MRITFVISSLKPGGAERVMSTMANYWSRKAWSITLITLANNENDFYRLDDSIARVSLGIDGKSESVFDAIRNNVRRVCKLRSAIRASHPDTVISFMDSVNITAILATLFTRTPVIIAERVDPRAHSIGRVWNILRNCLYPLANAVVVQTHDVSEWALQITSPSKIHVIPNAINALVTSHTVVQDEFPMPFILAVGRLEKQKGFDLLLRAFGKVVQRNSNWSLVILGEGSERIELERLTEELNIQRHVHLHGLHSRPATVMKRAEIFVLSSRFEGFPNVLLEAMACQLPVISFNCPSGPSEIVRTNVNGVLVTAENVDAMAGAIQDLIEDPIKRQALAANSIEVLERYSEDHVMKMWEETLAMVKGKNESTFN